MGNLTINIDSKAHYKIMEDSIMPAIVQFPTVVKEALEEFGPFFTNEPERKHFAEYITGLIIANRKNVSAILFYQKYSYPGCQPPCSYSDTLGQKES